MFQSTLLFNALRQENYKRAQPRLMHRISFTALNDALVTHYQNSFQNTSNSKRNMTQAIVPPANGLLIVASHPHKTPYITAKMSSSTSDKTNIAATDFSESTRAVFIDAPSLQVDQAAHQHTVILVAKPHDEKDISPSTLVSLEPSNISDDAPRQVSHILTWPVPLNPREEFALCYTPTFSYGLLGLEADPESDDPRLQRVITVQLEDTLDVIRALVKVVEVLTLETDSAADLRYVLLETLLSTPPLIQSSEQTSYVKLMNKLGCFRSDAERLESLALAVARRLQVAKTSLTTLRTSLRTLADKPKRNLKRSSTSSLPDTLASLAIPLVGAGPVTAQTQQHVMLAAVVATISDYLQYPKIGSDALFAMRAHVPERYPLQVFQSLSQHEREVLIDATPATLSGIVEGEDLFSVLQMAQTLSRDGTLLLEGLGIRDQQRGWVAFQAGQAVGIETHHETGLEALLEIVLWGASQFRFYDVTSVTAQPLNTSNSELLMSIATYLDILARLGTLGFSARAQLLRLNEGSPEKYADVLTAATTVPSFSALVATGYSRSTLLQALDYLTQTDWLEFGAILETPIPPLRQRK
jgi:hypothetical protein